MTHTGFGSEKRRTAPNGPRKVEYGLAYLRLKQRKIRGKFSADEWNAAVAKAQGLLSASESGQLTDRELKTKLRKL